MTRVMMILAGLAVIGLSALPSHFSKATAKDLGVHGAVFPVKEPDLLASIYSRLAEMEKNGDIDRANQLFAERARQKIERPPAVKGIAHTEEERTWLFDPTLTLTEDIRDHEGRLIASKGTTINPLDHTPFHQSLVFIDGDDDDQIQWARDAAAEDPLTQIILVRGAPLDLMKTHERPFFFDQHGVLTSRFGITHVPARVIREGQNLRISEVPL